MNVDMNNAQTTLIHFGFFFRRFVQARFGDGW
jgi:hypothetical protein